MQYSQEGLFKTDLPYLNNPIKSLGAIMTIIIFSILSIRSPIHILSAIYKHHRQQIPVIAFKAARVTTTYKTADFSSVTQKQI